MPSEVIVAILALIGTLVGSLGGIVVSSKLTNYRLEQLEKRVGEHNNFAARIPVLEERFQISKRDWAPSKRKLDDI